MFSMRRHVHQRGAEVQMIISDLAFDICARSVHTMSKYRNHWNACWQTEFVVKIFEINNVRQQFLILVKKFY